MVTVRLKEIIYRQAEYIGIYFDGDPAVNNVLRKFRSSRWSPNDKCWLLPMHREVYLALMDQLKGKARVDNTGLRKYLIDRKQKELWRDRKPGVRVSKIPGTVDKAVPPPKPQRNNRYTGIDPVNTQVLRDMEQHLGLKAYGKSTIKTYLNEMAQFLRALGSNPADGIATDRLKKYFLYCYEILKLSENTLNSRINALKFYFEQVKKRDRFSWEIPRPKKQLQLPKLLNEGELASLFNALPNKKHKAMLFTIYSAGLRVSEVVNLKLADIDSRRMQIFVGNAKGKKDRYVNLSPLLLDILREYVRNYNPRPLVYLFESEQTRTAYPARTVQQIFYNAKKRAGIRKMVGIHSLRHSFATHLLDKGTDIKYIKELLGHFNIKTTERYLHVSKRQLVNIESPFDDLWRSGGIKW